MAVSFLSVVLLVIVLGVAAISQVKSLADLSRQMYQPPFAVSNALLEANGHIIAMHRDMKDVVLARNDEKLAGAVSRVSDETRRLRQRRERL